MKLTVESVEEGPAPKRSKEEGREFLIHTRFFLISYVPLLLMFAARSTPEWTPTIPLLVLALIGLVDAYALTYGSTPQGSEVMTVRKPEDQGGLAAGYLASYLLPFLGAGGFNYGDYLAHGIFFLVLWVIFVRSDLALLNPTLYLLGWRIAECEGATGNRVLLLCRHAPAEGEQIRVVRFLGVYMQKGDAGGANVSS